MNIRKRLTKEYPDHELLFLSETEYDVAIIGVCEQFGSVLKIAYNGDKVLKILMKYSKMTFEDAYEYFNFNMVGAYMGENTPVYIWTNP